MDQLQHVHSRLYEILNNSKELENYITSLGSAVIKRNKHYQIVEIKELNYAFIIYKQYDLIAVLENVNPNLLHFISASGIKAQFKDKDQKEITAIDIIFFIMIKNVPSHHRNLGKLLLISQGTRIKDDYVPHHVLHPSINTEGTVKLVPRSINSSERAKFNSYTQVLDYIKTNIVDTNDLGFETFLYNIRFLANTYKKHRGIFVSNSDITKSRLDMDDINDINIDLSKY